MPAKGLEIDFRKKINCSNFIESYLDNDDLRNEIIEFIWFFNGTNNVKFLLDNNNCEYVDVLYEKYCKEIDSLIKYYDLQEIIEETDFFHGWFKSWKSLEKFTKTEFLNKLKTDLEFGTIWADFGPSDSLELRNWGVQISFDSEDRGRITQKGKDQIREIISSLANKPEDGMHLISYVNLTNSEQRIIQNNLIFNKFFCEKLSYEERVKWLFENFYETGLELKIMLESLRKENLDFLNWYDQVISIPKYKLNIVADYNMINDQKEFEKAKIFNYVFLLYFCKLMNMLPNNIYLNSTYKNKFRKNKGTLTKYSICLEKKDFANLTLDLKDFKVTSV